MKTKFFKKLSFVLAVAMILTVASPAAGVFAAKKPKLNATSKYLHLDVDGKNEFDFNISNKQKGWKYDWESADEDVVKVNNKGVVTATGVGKTKVTVYITDKDGESVAKLSATVTVRDNIKEVKISNAPEGKLAVGQEYDFNRSFVTVSGSTKKTSSITRWTVEPADGATINDSGLFKATKAGEYTITARSFQSKAKYEDWLKDSTTYAKYVLATDSVKVTVAASMTEAKQVDTDTAKVTFNSAMNEDDVKKNIAVYQMVGNTKVSQLIKSVSLDDEKKVATVDLYIDFVPGATYVIDYPEMESVSFVAATKNAEDVASMAIKTTNAVVNEETDVEIALYNKDGVDITTDALLTRVTLASDEAEGTYLNANAKKVIIFEKGKATKVTATYHTYVYDSTTGDEKGVITATGIITGVDAAATNVTGLAAWTITTGTPNWKNVNHLLAADDYGYKLFVKLNTKTGNNTAEVENTGSEAGNFEFTSSNESVLIIDNNGNLYPVKDGNAVIVVKYGTGNTKTPVATVSITVSAKKAGNNVTLSTYSFKMSNALSDTQPVKIIVKDQLGRPYNGYKGYSVERLSAPILSDGTQTSDQLTEVGYIPAQFTNGEAIVNFTAQKKTEEGTYEKITKGTYVYKITVGNISRVVTVTVDEPEGSVAYYRLELDATSKDMKVDSTTTLPVAVGIHLYAIATNGVKAREVDSATETAYRIAVDAPYDPNGIFNDVNNVTTKAYAVVTTGSAVGVTGSVIRKAPVGTYKVTAYQTVNGVEKVLNTVYFTTTDSQVTPTYTIKSKTYTNALTNSDISNSKSANLIAAVGGIDNNSGIKFTVDGDPVNIVEVEAVGTTDSIAIKSVIVRKLIKGTEGNANAVYLDYKVDLGGLVMKKK